MLQQPAVCASGADGAQGCNPCRAANGAPFPLFIGGGGKGPW